VGITNETVLRRVARVREVMRARSLDALVVYAAPTSLVYGTVTSGNVRYLTNWAGKGVATVLVLSAAGEAVLITTSPLNRRRIELAEVWVTDIRQVAGVAEVLTDGGAVRNVVIEKIGGRGRVGLIGASEMTAGLYNGLTSQPSPFKFEEADDILARLQFVKEPEEIELCRSAAKISDAMLYSVMNGARADRPWAHELMVEMEHTGRRLGADFAWAWIATGPAPDWLRNTLWEAKRIVEHGDRVQAGTYVIYEGYWGTGQRIGVKGKPSSDLLRFYQCLCEVQDAGLRELRPGNPVVNVHKAMLRKIAECSPYSGKDDPFRYRPGHGLGMQDSDPPGFDAFPQPGTWETTTATDAAKVEETKILVEPGMVFELHPNFSVPGLGFLAIGDEVVVTPSGPEVLTKFPRELYDL